MAPRRSFTVDPVLTAVAIAYRNQAQMLIADDVLPRQDVAQERFGWTSYPLAEAFTVPETRVGRTGKVNEVEFSGKEETSEVEDHGLDAPVVNSDVAAAAAARAAGRSIYDPEARAVEGLTDLVTLAREVRVAAVVQDDNNYAAARRVTLAGGDQLDDYEASDPIETIQTGIDGTLIYRPNTCVMGSVVWSKLRRHPHLVNAIKGNLTEKGHDQPRAVLRVVRDSAPAGRRGLRQPLPEGAGGEPGARVGQEHRAAAHQPGRDARPGHHLGNDGAVRHPHRRPHRGPRSRPRRRLPRARRRARQGAR
ncbi:capsid protein [Ancylobacter dichloromethanicus]